jgi:hypothetical protein
VLSEALSEAERAVERHLHKDGGKIAETKAVRILVQECRAWCQLEPEPQVEPETRCLRSHLGMGGSDLLLALGRHREHGPDVRGREEDSRAVLCGALAELEPFFHTVRPVVSGRDDVRVDVDEHSASLAAGRYSVLR